MAEPLDPRRTALVVVDLQNDFLHPDGAYARGGMADPAAAQLPARVADVARAVRAAGGLVAASLFTLWPQAGGEPIVSPHLRRLRPFLRRGDFQRGQWGHAPHDALAGLLDVTVDKVAYSAFHTTQLEWVLRHAGIDTLAFAGIVTHGGVASSVRDAHVREFRCIVLADGCAAFGDDRHRAALADLANLVEVSDCAAFTRGVQAAH